MIIGLHGVAGAGKDTIADHFVAKYGFEKQSFAAGLKRACIDLFGFAPNAYEDRAVKEAVDPEWGFSPRFAAQVLGTDLLRATFADDFFIRRMAKLCPVDSEQNVVIADVRFDNEAKWILDRGGHVFVVKTGEREVDGPPAPKPAALSPFRRFINWLIHAEPPSGKHSSENGISYDLITSFIDNGGDLASGLKRAEHELEVMEPELLPVVPPGSRTEDDTIILADQAPPYTFSAATTDGFTRTEEPTEVDAPELPPRPLDLGVVK